MDAVATFVRGAWVIVRGSQIGEYDFIGQVVAPAGSDPACGHSHYEIANYLSGEIITCCVHLLEPLSPAPAAPARRVVRFARIEHVSPFKN